VYYKSLPAGRHRGVRRLLSRCFPAASPLRPRCFPAAPQLPCPLRARCARTFWLRPNPFFDDSFTLLTHFGRTHFLTLAAVPLPSRCAPAARLPLAARPWRPHPFYLRRSCFSAAPELFPAAPELLSRCARTAFPPRPNFLAAPEPIL